MTLLARLFLDIALFFEDLWGVFVHLGNWFYFDVDWYYPARMCWDIADFFFDIYQWFRDVAYEVDDWWDEITRIASDLQYLSNSVWNTVWTKAKDAWDIAITAYVWADEALTRASSALQEIPVWLTDKLDAAYNLASTALQDIPSWILSKLDAAYNLASTALQEVPAWVSTQISDLQGGLDSLYYYAHTTVWNKAVDAWNKAANAFDYARDLVTGLETELRNWVSGIPSAIGTFVTDTADAVKSWTRTHVAGAVDGLAADIAAPINLVETWFEEIEAFFNDPVEYIIGKLENLVDRFATRLERVAERVIEAVW